MDSIANNSNMSKEMMESIMNSQSGKMIIQGNDNMTMIIMEIHEAMMKMMKDNPGMMHNMMMNMMEAGKKDTTLMSGMRKKMMENPQMMNMMQKMRGGKKDMNKMEGMDKMK